ncbi:hypothetical protein JAAARDRAFT_33164 [Jaapia argillacea MUCL 33604]|uniref:Structural maintenance of chromosomes protein n=1 Tax=Jaapia argillacea MUCL 33604 TaxID=933084 RepID=A0A067Q0A6_9AGAM|nr:hypothetical protein JAAARDRAFT_33164 [Jaapia argillacea MUCL 33604]
MRIEELVLEGFKSYPVRTQITGWDASFNAITGLNGSGKSNILDAICFVLGMTNTAALRAQNQQDLIYKRGQAGIAKASVTIVFDNSDRSTSPPGMENCKQITVTRQIALPNISKYLLNGHKSQQQTIQTLFQSVQLNINNPNFLIMQGRITKVLNMRPPEILGMIEEASGTRMFEDRKSRALRTIQKKEKRVTEITSLLAEEITPKLDGLRKDKATYLAFQKAVTELERIGRVLRAWEWSEGKARVEAKAGEIEAKEKEGKKAKKDRDRLVREGEEAEREKEELEKLREKEMKKGGKYKKLEEEVGELGKDVVRARTQVELMEGSVKEEEGKVEGLVEELAQLEEALVEKKTQVESLTKSFNTVKDSHTATQTTLTTSEELLQSLLTGLASSSTTKSNSGGGYMGQLATARQTLATQTAYETQAKQKLEMSLKGLGELEVKWKKVEREVGEGTRKVDAMRKEVQSLRERVGACGWTEERVRERDGRLRGAREEVRRLTEERDSVKARLSNLSFDYTSPYAGFDDAKVKGLVASLITLDEGDYGKATALEITAGGKLYNVVVQDEKVAKDLLTGGRLRKRVTIIPLNKISGNKMQPQKLQAALNLAPGKVRLALSLVGYPEEVSNAMSFVFGDTLITDDAESAKLCTFSPLTGGVRSVTLDGDVYDPSGTLSGGAKPSGNGVLIRVQELVEAEKRLDSARGTLKGEEAREAKEREGRVRWEGMKRDLEVKEHELRLAEGEVEGSNAARIGTQIEELKKTIEKLREEIQGAQDKQRGATEEIQKLEKDMDEFKNNKDGKIDELKADISKQKAALQKQAVVVKTQQKELQTAQLELEQMEKDIESAQAAIEEARAGIQKIEKQLTKLRGELAKSTAALDKAQAKLSEEQATLTRFDNELKDLDAAIKEKKQAISDIDLALKKLEHDIGALGKEKVGAVNFVASLEKQYDWILEESEMFGKPGSLYHFASMDIGRLKEKARDLEERQKGMKKKVNPKVVTMIDDVEKREVALKKMLATVLKDKEKIEATIEELDRYKRDALEKTWTKVNSDFGGIFAELLPGNFAKLQPPDGQDLTQGLEVKVRLGSVWKQSLTELSGGQRSLIALSLIMSLLQFKPAPMYILDEIDAALDLSHTQHIGQLFRTRFKGSQFIVVSLKEGLFTNANVLFRTRFRDGTSIVERTSQRSGSGLYAGGDEEEVTEGGRRRRAARS